MAEDEHGRWHFDADELGIPMTDAATMGRSMGESIIGARSHRFLLNNECATIPYLSRQLSVFCKPTSEFIRMSHCCRKTMVASKRHEELYWFRLEPYVLSQR